jgi:hypothetical protein
MLTRQGLLIGWRALAAIAVVVASGAMLVLQAQQRNDRAGFTTQDYIDIQQLVARYPYTFDGGLEGGKAYADLFTSDGVFINQDGRHEGRPELERMGGARRARTTPLNVAHYIVNHVIDPISASTARGKQYLAVLTIGEEGPVHGPRPGSIRLGGMYHDEYEKTAQGWRFKTRHFINKDTTEGAVAFAEKLRTIQAPAR